MIVESDKYYRKLSAMNQAGVYSASARQGKYYHADSAVLFHLSMIEMDLGFNKVKKESVSGDTRMRGRLGFSYI